VPIEIKEMHIKINVAETKGGGGGGGTDSQKVVEECMTQVKQLLKNTKER